MGRVREPVAMTIMWIVCYFFILCSLHRFLWALFVQFFHSIFIFLRFTFSFLWHEKKCTTNNIKNITEPNNVFELKRKCKKRSSFEHPQNIKWNRSFADHISYEVCTLHMKGNVTLCVQTTDKQTNIVNIGFDNHANISTHILFTPFFLFAHINQPHT